MRSGRGWVFGFAHQSLFTNHQSRFLLAPHHEAQVAGRRHGHPSGCLRQAMSLRSIARANPELPRLARTTASVLNLATRAKSALTNYCGRHTVCSMTITIPDELDDFVRAKLQAGGFESPAAVVTAALAAWQGQEVYRAMDRGEVEHLLLEAIDSPRIPWDEANFDRIIESLREKHGAA